MKTTSKTLFLTVEVAKTLVGKIISWRAPMDEENWDDSYTPKFFGGKCIIKKINSDKRLALVCETISGNDLSYAILEDEELQPVNGSDTRFSLCPATGDKRTFTYSDLYREVEIIDIKETAEAEDEEAEEEHADNILEVMFEGDKTAESKQFESNLIEFFKIQRMNAGLNAGAKAQIIKANYDDRVQLSGVYGFDECRKIENQWFSLDSFIAHVADMIGFEIAERIQSSEYATVVNESGFKLSVTKVEA